MTMNYVYSFLVMLLFPFITICGQQLQEHANMQTLSRPLRSAVGDSIADIVCFADTITIEVSNDGERDARQNFPAWVKPIVMYAIWSPNMYKTNKKVYTRFEPYAWLTFVHAGGKVEMQIDYGINKWMLVDAEGQILRMHDMPQKELLPLLFSFFPENESIKTAYTQLMQGTKK